MPNIVINNNATAGVVVSNPVFEPEVLTFAGADVWVAGTILARDSISLKLVLFVKGGVTNENGIPKAVLTQPAEAAGAGDQNCMVLIGGQVRKSKLIIDADGSGVNVDKAVTDALRDYGIEPLSTTQLSKLDNQ